MHKGKISADQPGRKLRAAAPPGSWFERQFHVETVKLLGILLQVVIIPGIITPKLYMALYTYIYIYIYTQLYKVPVQVGCF